MASELPKGPLTELFDGGYLPQTQFDIEFDNFEIGGSTYKNTKLTVSYDKRTRLEFHGILEADTFQLFSDIFDSASASDEYLRESIEFFSTEMNQTNNKIEIKLRLKREDLDLRTNQEASRLEAIIINGPEILFSDYSINFLSGDFSISMKEFAAVRKIRSSKEEFANEYIATSTLSIQRSDKIAFLIEDGMSEIYKFVRFLTFVRGAYCGVGNIAGYNDKNQQVSLRLGFTKSDVFKTPRGWCDMGVIKNIPDVYSAYNILFRDSENIKPILTAIEFYRSSNIIKDSTGLEMAIVASHAAIETLVPFLLSKKAGWSNNMLTNQISFHDKFRAAASYLGILTEPLEHATALQARSRAESGIDAFELTSKFRNRIVHQGKIFKYSGSELNDVWNLLQWFCEIFIFFLLGWRGEINDRRRVGGWRGHLVNVPLPPI